MILVDYQIREAVRSGALTIENFSDDGIQPASYDMRIGDRLYSASAAEPEKPIDLATNGHAYRIPPYGQVVLLTHETLKLPRNMVGRFGLTSSLTRKGLSASAGPQVDPGYEGKLFVTLWNQTPVSHMIEYLDKFLSIEFNQLEKEPEHTYSGPYQGRRDVSSDILRDLVVRAEGFNLNQMQSQFTALASHLEEWSAFVKRADTFIAMMEKHNEIMEKLVNAPQMQLAANGPLPITTRRTSIKRAMAEILELFKTNRQLFYSDIAEALNLDFATVIEACDRLQKEGRIEGVGNE
jgi:dCTP deaminase